jgi:hypothetical protein
MAAGVFDFQYEVEKRSGGMTGLAGDDGLCRILKSVQCKGLSRKERRVHQRRLRKEIKSDFPSASSIFRYLNWFHDSEQEKHREPEKSFIPAPNAYLRALAQVIGDFVASVQRRCPQKIATLDMDATLVETSKNGALD